MSQPKIDLFAKLSKAELTEVAMKRRKESAHHEAGHAVMFWLWWDDSNIHRISMKPNAKRLASVDAYSSFTDATVIAAMRTAAPEIARMKAIAEIMKHMAGPAAGSRFDETGSEWFAVLSNDHFDTVEFAGMNADDTDMGRAIAAAKALYGDSDEISRQAYRFLRTVAKWTEEAVSHAKVWTTIEALATRLETQQTMQASTVVRVIETTMGDWRGVHRLHALGRKWKNRIPLPVITNE